MTTDGNAFPGVFQPSFMRNLGLLGKEDHDLVWNLMGCRRKSALHLEGLQEQRESQAGGAALVAQQLQFGRLQRPIQFKILPIPAALHATSTRLVRWAIRRLIRVRLHMIFHA